MGAAEPRQDDFDAFLAPIDTSGVRINQIVAEGASVSHVASRFAESEKVDLIVMGSRGQTRSASVLLGSESEQMLTESSVPVLIAKRRGERISLLQALLDRSLHLPEPPRFN